MPFALPVLFSGLVVLSQAASGPAAVQLEVEHEGPLVLGEVERVSVKIQASENRETVGRPLRISVNVGSFDAIARVSAGVYRTSYLLPSTRHPQVALVAVWRETGPDAPISFFRIPLSGRTTLPVGTRPGATVRVLVEDARFGPVIADRKGRAAVPIVVPPGVKEVVATSTTGRTETQATVDTGVPPYNRLTLAVTPYLIEANGRSAATAHVWYDAPGEPPSIDRILLSAKSGEITTLSRDGQRYLFRFVPERGSTASSVELSARVRGDRASSAAVKLGLGTPTPSQIVIRAPEAKLIAGANEAVIAEVLIADSLGLGVERLTVTATTSAGRILGIEEKGQGRYAISVVPPADYPEGGTIELRVQAGALRGADRLAVEPGPWPTSARLESDPEMPTGESDAPFMVSIFVSDAAGRPFEGAKLKLAVSSGRASRVEESGGGEYKAAIAPDGGDESIVLRIADETGHLGAEHRIEFRGESSLFGFGVGGGAGYWSTFVPQFMFDLRLRPGLADHRLAFYLAVSYRFTSRSFALPPALASGGQDSLTGTLHLLPISLGLSYDLIASRRWSLYVGGGGVLAAYMHRLDTDLFDTPIERGFAPGAELLFGATFRGFFVQLNGTVVPIEGDEFTAPPFMFGLMLGYRTGAL